MKTQIMYIESKPDGGSGYSGSSVTSLPPPYAIGGLRKTTRRRLNLRRHR